MAPKKKNDAPPRKKTKIASSSTGPELTPYPLGRPKFSDPAYEEHYQNLLGKAFVISPSIDLSALAKCGIQDKVLSLLSSGGLQILVDVMHLGQYEIPTREFVATFETYDDDDGGGWKFYLGGKFFVLSKREVCNLFKFPYSDGVRYDYDPEVRDEMWKEISGMDMFVPLMSPKNIHDGAWKYIHRLLTLCLFVRKDGGRLVQGQDFDAMVSIWKGNAIDGFYYLTKMFKIWGAYPDNNLAIGGGAFVSLIAEAYNVDLSTLGTGGFKPLDENQLVAFEMWTKKPPGWVHITKVTDRVKTLLEERLKKKRKADARAAYNEAHAPYDSVDDFPRGESSSYRGQGDKLDMVISRLDRLELKMDNYFEESRTQHANLLAAFQGHGGHFPSSSSTPYPPPGPFDYYGNARPDDRLDDL